MFQSSWKWWTTRTRGHRLATAWRKPWFDYRIVAIPKSVHKEWIAENFDIFDFELTADEMSSIATLDTGASSFFDHRDPAMVKWLIEAKRPT